MASVEKTTCGRLAPAERDELEAILRAHRRRPGSDPALADRFHSDFNDAVGWWILVLLMALVGAGACALDLLQSSSEPVGFLEMATFEFPLGLLYLLRSDLRVLMVLALAVAVWVAVTWVRNHGRRGLAATSFGTLKLRARRVTLLRHADVARITRTRHGSRGRKFSVLDLTAGDGRRLRLYATGNWASQAIDVLQRARVAAGLRAIEGDALRF